MPPPNDYALPGGVKVQILNDGSLWLSDALLSLLVDARSYDLPAGTGARESQQTILELEASTAQLMVDLNEENAHSVVINVSTWAGNNARSHEALVQAIFEIKVILIS